MGVYVIKPLTKIAAWLVTIVLVYLNIRMVVSQVSGVFTEPGNLQWKILIVLGGLIYIGLLIISVLYPLMSKKRRDIPVQVHAEATDLDRLAAPVYNKIGVALEFSQKDERLISHAIGQANKNTSFVLIHIVESVPARIFGNESDDLETRKDQEHLEFYVQQLKARGYEAIGMLGFRSRSKEIVRIVKQTNAEMLVIGAHGHSGIKDWLYGETIDSVRHELKIPVLIVNV